MILLEMLIWCTSAQWALAHRTLHWLQASEMSNIFNVKTITQNCLKLSNRLSAFAQREKQHQQLRSLSSRDLGANSPFNVGSPVNTTMSSSWSKWGSPTGKVDWSVNVDEFGKLKRSSSFELNNNGAEEPDLSWVQSLVKESPPEMMKNKSAAPPGSGNAAAPSGEVESSDHSVLGAWLEQMQLDQLVA